MAKAPNGKRTDRRGEAGAVVGAREPVALSREYRRFVGELKSRVLSARLSAARAVNRELILLYWDIGRAIAEKQRELGWGESVVELVAKDLQRAFPGTRGFSADSLWRMRQFYREYAAPGFLEQVVPEIRKRGGQFLEQAVPGSSRKKNAALYGKPATEPVRDLIAAVPWGHHVELLKKVSAPLERLYYLRATARFGWSRNVLLNQIKAGAYERAVADRKAYNFPLAIPILLAV